MKNGKHKNKFVEQGVNTYRNKLSCYSPGQWFSVPKDFLFIMDYDEAILMAFLINAADTFLALERYDGWFYYTMRTMEEETGMARNKQGRVIRSLEEKGFIKRKRIGLPPKRFFLINVDMIEKMVNESRAIRRSKRRKTRRDRLNKFLERREEKEYEREFEGK